MFERILVPLDGSELSERALPYAEELGTRLGSEIILITVGTLDETMEHPERRVYLSKTVANMEQGIKKSAARAAVKVKVPSSVVSSPDHILRPAHEFLDYADKENIDLIIMGTHGRTGITRWMLGSTANKVVQAFKCPILLIRAKGDMPASVHLEKILVPLDGSKESEAVLPFIEYLASKIEPAVSLLNIVEMPYHVYASPVVTGYGGAGIARVPYNEEELKPFREAAEKYIKSVNDKLAAAGIQVNSEVRVGSPGDEIIEVEKEMRPDIVAMSTHGHSGFGRFDHGSITDKVLHGGNTPLLLVRPQQP